MSLSRCAHCGAVAHINKSVTDPHLCWSVQCSNLDCGMTTRAFSQQQQAVDAWQHSVGPAPIYSHRNGETETPTPPGLYWFQGARTHGRNHAEARRVRFAGMVTVDEDGAINPNEYLTSRVLAWDGQWWGPVQVPWEQ